MRSRAPMLSALATVLLVVSACTGGATPAPSSGLKIGVVTDIGSLNDKNFNEYSYKGAQDGASAIGAANPPSVTPKSADEYAQDINSFVKPNKFDVIVTVGFNMAGVTTTAAGANKDIKFIGVDQSPICVDASGKLDTTFACKGDAKTLLPNYQSLEFQEDQAGYLAGIVAASMSKSGEIGAIGGTTLCAPCVRYIQGYQMGAQSVNANIKVDVAYVTRDFSNAAFYDQPGGKKFADTFLTTNSKVDVLFQVAGQTGNGVLDSACSHNIWGVGVDVDQFLSYPAADKCLLTSAEKHLQTAVSSAIKAVAAGTFTPGDTLFNAANNGIGVSDFHDKASQVPSTVTDKINSALTAMKAGTLKTCPDKGCGVGPS